MKVSDYLSIPYMIEAEAVEGDDGEWCRRLSYPELADFKVDTLDVETGLRQLEVLRIREIIRQLRSGTKPPMPRPPLRNSDPEWLARNLGIWDEISGVLDLTEDQLARMH